MKDQRDRLVNLKKNHAAAQQSTDVIAKAFLGTHCRYRNSDDTCGHGRHNMKKFPQHIPKPPRCSPVLCSRN